MAPSLEPDRKRVHPMKVLEIWRYPVKSMAGEKIDRAILTSLGIAGDRVIHVEDSRGRFITASTHPRLLGHHAKLNSSGEPTVDGLAWKDPQVLRHVVEIVGPGAHLIHGESADRFDILPLLIATDGAISAFGYDGRRLRPNVVIGGVDDLAERSWPGQRLRIRGVLIGIEDLRSRCVMTTFDPDTLKQDAQVLKGIVQRFGGKLALNCYVIQDGEIREGDSLNCWRPINLRSCVQAENKTGARQGTAAKTLSSCSRTEGSTQDGETKNPGPRAQPGTQFQLMCPTFASWGLHFHLNRTPFWTSFAFDPTP